LNLKEIFIIKCMNGYDKNKVLFIEGARQIGKTHVINNFVDKNFKDEEHFVIVIDEIQEDYNIFNKIRQFSREFKAKFIVTGSYFGLTIMRDEFKQSAGDTVNIEMNSMTFEEFIKACGKYDLYKSLDLYGKSKQEEYDTIQNYFNDYLKVGGYPESVERYILTGEADKSYYKSLLITILNESQKYFNLDSIQGTLVDYNSLESCIHGITRLLLKEKKGLDNGNYNMKVTENNCNLAMAWIDRAGLINDCCKVADFKFDEKTFNQRFYFNDVGLSNYLFEIYNKGELDFVYFNKESSLLYGIEVNAGRNTGGTIAKVLQDKKMIRHFIVRDIRMEELKVIK